MKKTIISLILVLGFVSISKAQSSLNDYKYVIVENQFHFQNEANEYDLNELTRFLFKKHGFKPILDSDVYPDDLKSNYCLALTSEVIAKGAFITKITIVLRDCNNNILFSCEAKTKEKEFKKVYNIGIRKAFESFNDINYKYIPNEEVVAKGDTSKDEIEELKAEIKSLKTDQNKVAQKTEDVKEDKKLHSEIKEEKEKEDNNVEQVEEIEEKPFINPERVVAFKEVENYLIAKSITNGFELVNSKSNKVEFIIHIATPPNVFIIKDKNGIIYKKGNQWVREYINGDKTVIESLDVRF